MIGGDVGSEHSPLESTRLNAHINFDALPFLPTILLAGTRYVASTQNGLENCSFAVNGGAKKTVEGARVVAVIFQGRGTLLRAGLTGHALVQEIVSEIDRNLETTRYSQSHDSNPSPG